MTDYRTLARIAASLKTEADSLRTAQRNGTAGHTEIRRLADVDSAYRQAQAIADAAQAAELDETREIARTGKTIRTGSEDAETRSFLDYLRTGAENRAALVAGTGANGGFVVPEPLHAPLAEAARRVNPILRLATVLPLEGGNVSMKLPMKATHGGVANATETGARSEQTEPTFTSSDLTAHDYYTDQRVSQTWLDSVPDSETMMLRWVGDDLHEQAAVDMVNGDGSGKCSGIFAATTTYANVKSGQAAAIANTMFTSILTALNPKYRGNGAWLMNSTTLSVCMNMSAPNLNNTPLVTFALDGTPQILGKPVVEVQSAPDIAAGTFPIAFGDVAQGYAVGIHSPGGVNILRDPFTANPLVKFLGVLRIGGRPWNPEAIVLGKVSA